MLFQATRRPGIVLTLALVKLAVELGCYLVIVPRLGGIGAAWANLAGAVVSYALAMGFTAAILPETARERAGVALRGFALVLPFLGLSALLVPQGPHGSVSLALRILLVLPATFGLFALRLVTRYDLEKLSGLPLQAGLARRVRDSLVRVADPLARLFESRRPA